MISDEMIKSGNGSFVPFSPSSGLLESRGVQCGRKSFVYLLNNTDSLITTPVTFPIAAADSIRLRRFNPEDLSFTTVSNVTVAGNSISTTIILDSNKESVLIVDR